MRKLVFVLILSLLLSVTPVGAQQDTPFKGVRVATVMTYNVYHGANAEFDAVVTASGFPDLLQKVAAIYQGYFARDFPQRAAAIAAQVEAVQPELIGLQEAVLVRTQFPADGPATPATTVALDYVQILLDALEARGLHYQVAVQSIGFDAELPSALGFDVRHTDREVILARADLETNDLKLSNPQAGNFATNCTIPAGIIGSIVFKQGWASVDAKIRGKSFRLVSTHLDPVCVAFTPAIQSAQTAELLAGPAATNLPVVLVGDLNSPADGSGVSYNLITGAGFADAVALGGAGDGATCCQADDLLNPDSTLETRVDQVLFRGEFSVLDVAILGDAQADRTPFGFWPSDHAGVGASLVLPHP